MPITRRQFDLGISDAVEDCMGRVHEFLAARRNQAFSRDEIFEAVSGEASLRVFNDALDRLAEIRAIDVRYLKGRPYYAYLEDLDHVW